MAAGVLPLALLGTGAITSVGLNSPATGAAIRSGLANPTESRFTDSFGEWMLVHAVAHVADQEGRARLVEMAAHVVCEALKRSSDLDPQDVPLLLCVSEESRPGRVADLDVSLIEDVQSRVGATFAPESMVIAHGRVGAAVGLLQARKLLHRESCPAVLVVGTDSLLTSSTLDVLEGDDRLLTSGNSNGCMPGEAAGALLVGRPAPLQTLIIEGLGFGVEKAHIGSEVPLRAEGLSTAISSAFREAGRDPHEVDFRITDNSGEHYYFKETALAMSRALKVSKEQFELWHPAECVGEVGSAALPIQVVVAEEAFRKRYAPGPGVLIHAGTDSGQRTAMVVRYAGA